MYVLSVGDFDERIFLGEDSSAEIGTPAKSGVNTGDLAERMEVKRIQSFDPVSKNVSVKLKKKKIQTLDLILGEVSPRVLFRVGNCLFLWSTKCLFFLFVFLNSQPQIGQR